MEESERTEEESEWMKLLVAQNLLEHHGGEGGWRAVCEACRAGTQDGRECVRLGICVGKHTHTGSHEDTHTHASAHTYTQLRRRAPFS